MTDVEFAALYCWDSKKCYRAELTDGRRDWLSRASCLDAMIIKCSERSVDIPLGYLALQPLERQNHAGARLTNDYRWAEWKPPSALESAVVSHLGGGLPALLEPGPVVDRK
jgi:hypothetical protein